MKKGFFAYSSTPEYCGEFIEEAITRINESFKDIVELKSWLFLQISGRLIINEVLKEIDDCDFFCADLTGMNNNVLFELGYAIAIKKPIWIIFDKSDIESNKRFNELNFFSTIGYSSYTSSKNIVTNFSETKVFERESSLYESLTKNLQNNQGENALFYLKSQVDTNYSQDVINEIEYYNLPYLLDDPVETKLHPLTWYIEKIFSVPAILIEFSSTHRVGNELHNLKCSFVAGFSVGLGLKTLMISEKPFVTPIDYRELLVKYSNRSECQQSVRPFLEVIQKEIAQLILKRRHREIKQKERTKLQKINFGEFIAEHESENLFDYYIETAHSQNLIKSEHNIIIGRKGTGKTATLYFLEQALSKDIRNHICVIKPVNFEIDGLISLYNSMKDEFEQGYMIEAIWKFLIYTEIAKSIYELLIKKPIYAKNEDENIFLQFVEKHRTLILTDFSSRLEQQIEDLLSIDVKNQGDFKVRISEILHNNILLELRTHIVKNIHKNGKLVVLIDNLDKSWRKDSNVLILSRYILGLLGVVGRIAKDFSVQKNNVTHKFSFHLIIFLRSDIFKYIMNSAREPDKIEYTRLSWNDKETLLRIIELRFEELTTLNVTSAELWEVYVVKQVKEVDSKDFILNNIFPRPRDLIYFLSSAKNLAVSRGHSIITEEDLVSAYSDYSNWVFKSIIVENGITIKQMEDFMYNLMGEKEILTEENLQRIALNSEIDVNEKVSLDKFIDHLVSLTIFGREIKESVFEFEYEFDYDIKLKSLSNKMKVKRFKIHNALIPYLEIEK
jgi:Cdc6-like AAA superfamily ATPase